MDDITAGMPNKIKIVDDTMLYEETVEECFFATCNLPTCHLCVQGTGWYSTRPN